jgi:PhnB protein
MQVMVQLEFDGQCRQAFEYYAEVLKGEIKVMNSHGDTQKTPLPPGSRPGGPDLIRFAQLKVGDNVIQGNDLPRGDYRAKRGLNVALHVRDASDARRIFNAFADGGHVETPLSEVAWSSAFGIVRDRFDTPWLILAMDRDTGTS